MSEPPSYNLLDQPWILAVDLDGREQALSLLQVVDGAPRLRRLAGELPTQDVAILRLILAVLHRALQVTGDEEQVRETWGQWWEAGALPAEHVVGYLETFRDKFDLLSTSQPFFQVADLHTASGKTSGLGKVIADLPAGHKFFTNRAGYGAESLSLAEAARWLVHCQAFDPSGIKTGAVGDPRVKGGRGYPIGTGWTGNLGVVVVEGANLAQALLLNLVLARPSPEDDLPPWEVGEWTAAPTDQVAPRGPAQAMTWQQRRVRLFPRDGRIRDVLISNGDQIRVRNQHHVETMTGWRRSAAQEKKHGEPQTYMPREHASDRAVWRGLQSLVAAPPVARGARDGEQALEAENLHWVASLRTAGLLPRELPVTIHAVGAVYGTQSAFIETLISDRIAFRAEVLSDAALQDAAVRAATVAEAGARTLGRLGQDLAVAEGRDGVPDRDRGTEHGLQMLDPRFRGWVRDLSGAQMAPQEEAWRQLVREQILQLGDEMYAAASPAAIRGRVRADRNGRPQRVDAALAHLWFTRKLRIDIPLVTDDLQADRTESDQADATTEKEHSDE
ncbi:type I-E CRISPR-associated protein Cse1/CasA [Ornithinimicrobium cavernae]|uniref:type I-E CRISPR-associated protein Cse1/CasA n=1 Tax=Ornithinimicrobium cavernae TaxID=2666047 RepID=UPI000D6961D6|nr:type I-E CRISPR-associated protein Cse1/CasA [Ornithinimicrobium cavernae]